MAASSSSATSGAQVITVDDSATAAIKYSAGATWLHLSGQPSGVLNGTSSKGFTNASATFVFRGTDVALYGVAFPALMPPPGAPPPSSADPPSVQLILDGQLTTGSLGEPPYSENTAPMDGWLWQRLSNLDPSVEHILEIKVEAADSAWPFILDYIQYTPPDASGSATGSAVSTTGTAVSVVTTPPPYSTTPGSSPPISSAAESMGAAASTGAASVPADSGSHRPPVGAIVGVALAAVVFMTLLVVVAFLWGRRRGRRGSRSRRVPHSESESDLNRPMSFISTSTHAVRHLRDPEPSGSQPYPHAYPAPSDTASLSLSHTEDTRSTLSSAHSGSLDLVGIFLAPPSPTSAVPRPRPAKPPRLAGLANVAEDEYEDSEQGDDAVTLKGETRTAARPAASPPVFHSDSGMRFADVVRPPVPVRAPSPVRSDVLSDVTLPEVPPQYTER
ncbi:hypothetical protein C2E23DRAFT_883514 [Lenzites betulinus]|nr:hypothetical protein C2E23DRAFT_883514 [Lenzites betulinus]